jgi:hypothetical protein
MAQSNMAAMAAARKGVKHPEETIDPNRRCTRRWRRGASVIVELL